MKSILLALGICSICTCYSTGQSSPKSVHFRASLTPQVSSMWNGSRDGTGRATFGYVIEVKLVTKLSDRLQLHTGFNVQDSEIKQRYNNLQWPSDVENGMWVPGRSYEQFEAKYFAIGLDGGFDFALTTKENNWSLNGSVALRRMLNVNDKLIINESGNLHDPIEDELKNTFNKTQILISLGCNYNFHIGAGCRFFIGPSFEYSIRDLIGFSVPQILWTYDGGHPVFFGLKTGVIF